MIPSQTPEEGFLPHPPTAPRLSARENVIENVLPVKSPARMLISSRGSNPRFHRPIPSLPQSAGSVSPIIPNAPIPPSEARSKYSSLLNA
jgi:hypothetical protein